jgi:hypothetical protein
VSRARRTLGWKPTVSPAEGVDRLLRWISENRAEIAGFLARKGVLISASASAD